VHTFNTMAPTSPQGRSVPSDDELDNILRDIAEGKDVTGTTDSQTQQYLPKESYGDGLGIDEEIIVTKKRIPIPKLDENRLLSDPGIPRLRKISKERLRFKGKGHEVWQLPCVRCRRSDFDSMATSPACSTCTNCGSTTCTPAPSSPTLSP
jgi:hypothetical protein